jgi:hypothetical protein
MAGFETIVRPVVFPNIRPAPTRSLPPADDPEQGKCTIGGGGGGIISTSESGSASGSTHNPKETERRVDVARVYQKEDDGTINKENFIDIEVANRIKMESDVGGDAGAPVDGVGDADALRDPNEGAGGGKERNIFYYAPVQEKDNIEVKKRNIINRRGEEVGDAGAGE